MIKTKRSKTLKIIIPVILMVLGGTIAGTIVAIKNSIIHTSIITRQITKNNVEKSIISYFNTDESDRGGNENWFFRNKREAYVMSYKHNSVKVINNQKEYSWTAIIKVEESNTKKAIGDFNIKLDWRIPSDLMKTGWNQITNEINQNEYYDHPSTLTKDDVSNFIKSSFLQDHKTWYVKKTATKIDFTTNNDVKLNDDGWFTENLNPSITTDGNKSVLLLLKWFKKADENKNDIISIVKNAGYVETAPLIESIVIKDVNDYLADKWWVENDPKEDVYKLASIKAVASNNDSSWVVTLTESRLFITRNMSFTPFDIILDWKNQDDVAAKLSEIKTQLKKNNYNQQITFENVLILFQKFINSGKWTFKIGRMNAKPILVEIAKNNGNAGKGISHVDASINSGRVWKVYTGFDYINEDSITRYWTVEVYLDWRSTPTKDKTYSDIWAEYSYDGYAHNCKYTFTPK